MRPRDVRRLRPIASHRWELRKLAALLDRGRRAELVADIEEITTTGEIPRVKRNPDHEPRLRKGQMA